MELYKNYNIEDLDGEVWIDCLGYDGIYSVSNFGRVKSELREVRIKNGTRIKKATIMRQNKHAPLKKHQQHLSVLFSVDGIQKRQEVSLIVGTSFLGVCNINEIFCHANGNALDNRLENIVKLEYSDSSAEPNKIHPTQKPVALYDWLIRNYAQDGDKILDTHLGSGSIAIAVMKANSLDNRNISLTGIEIDKEYYDASIRRIKSFQSQAVMNFDNSQ